MLTSKLHRFWLHLPYLPRAFALVWSAAPAWTAVWLGLLVAQGLLPVAMVYLTRWLVDALAAGLRPGDVRPGLTQVLLPGGLLAGVLLLTELLRAAARWVRAVQSELLQDRLTGLIHDKSVDADLAFYEQPEFHDHLHRARQEAGHRPLALLENLGVLLQDGLALVAMGAVLVPFGLWLPAALLVSTLPALAVVLRHTVRQHAWRLRVTEDERHLWYYEWLLTSPETAMELRLFGLGPRFRAAYQALRRRLRGERLRLVRDESLAAAGAGLFGLAVTAAALAWMVVRVLGGQATLGDLAMVYQAFQQGQRLFQALLQNVGQLYANTLFLGNLFEFLDLRPQVTDPPAPVPVPAAPRDALRFRDVTFRYPGSERPALQDFNLTIPADRVVALVGPNGAGKSTLIKLLCRFYDPQAGRVELDGRDLRSFALDELRDRITVLFQQPVHYSTTIAENIALGCADEPGADRVEAAARAAGAEAVIARQPKGYATRLGKWLTDGTELSTGEYQRLALARALLRSAPILLLDEPTSAMDPWAEADWLQRLHDAAAGRTVLLITHRFTTARHADVIHVVDGGRVVESGSHAELVARGGVYGQSWARQGRE